jgi:hypothetical protein
MTGWGRACVCGGTNTGPLGSSLEPSAEVDQAHPVARERGVRRPVAAEPDQGEIILGETTVPGALSGHQDLPARENRDSSGDVVPVSEVERDPAVSSVSPDDWSRLDFVGDFVGVDARRSPPCRVRVLSGRISPQWTGWSGRIAASADERGGGGRQPPRPRPVTRARPIPGGVLR